MKSHFNKSQKIVLAIIIFGILARLIPHPPNFSPVTAIALFSGLNLKNKKFAFLIPILILFISDLFIGISVINIFVYSGFLLVVQLGSKIRSIRFLNIILASLIFFIISNFGVWIIGYPKTIDGLILCYTMAIPFFGYSLAGDLFFGYLLKFSFAIIESYYLNAEI